jgi:hypothetical protein
LFFRLSQSSREILMNRYVNLLTTFAVTSALLASAVVSGQVEKAAAKEPAKAVAKKAVEAKPAAVVNGRIIMRNAAVAGEDQAKALADNLRRQLRPLVRAQLHVIKTVCATTKEEQSKLARDSDPVLDEATKKFADTQLAMQRGMAIQIGQQQVTSPRELVRDGILKLVKTQLPADRAGRYQAEVDAQIANEMRVAARNLVARFDEELVLSTEQREKISEALAKSKDSTVKNFEGNFYNGPYFPAVPDNLVTPHLNPSQLRIWQSTQKVHFGPNFSATGISGLQISEEDLAEYDEPAEKSGEKSPVPMPDLTKTAPPATVK